MDAPAFAGASIFQSVKKHRKEGEVWRGNHQGSPLRIERSGSKPHLGGRKWGKPEDFPHFRSQLIKEATHHVAFLISWKMDAPAFAGASIFMVYWISI